MQTNSITPAERPFFYNENHCWQYEIRLNNREEDLVDAGLTQEEADQIEVYDQSFRYVDKSEADTCQRIVKFIEKHEWLGKMPLHPTHRFVAEYRGQLAGVIIMSMPTSFSTLLGPDTKNLERLISRGACVSWSPHSTASAMLMYAIDWMVKNTLYRLFTCYADTEAKEVGIIYQSCNFLYLGQDSGTRRMYYDPKRTERGYFSDRSFRSRSAWKRYAKALGIVWQPEWQKGESIFWDRIPADIAQQLRGFSKAEQKRCQYRLVPPKHKYALIVGKDRRETKQLKRRFAALNPKLTGLPYPKERAPKLQMPHDQCLAVAPCDV